MYQDTFWKFVMIYIITLTTGEVIKLENKTHIHCINDVNKDGTLFLTPPLEKLQTVQNLKDNLIWNNNDWHFFNGTSVDTPPILDKRWEDLFMYKKNYTRLNLSTAVSLSVYRPYNGLEIFIYNHDHVVHRMQFNDAVYNESQWYHYTILLKNSTAYLFENNKIVAKDNFVPTNVVFRNLNKQFYFKKHQDRKFLWSNKTTEDEKPSIIKIPPTGKSCLFLYTSLCKECDLEVIQNNKKTTIISINQESNLMESWQMQRLEINPNKEDILKIYKKIITNNSTGHWVLDFRLCDANNTVTYKKEEESVDYTCNSLNIDSNKRAKRSSLNHKKLCPAGKLGRNCDISCENVLNSNFQYCDKHKICNKNTDCNCAWGYNGQFCNNLCEEGKWGLSCKEDCKGCMLCNKHTGECKTTINITSIVDRVVVVTVILVVVVGVLLVVVVGVEAIRIPSIFSQN